MKPRSLSRLGLALAALVVGLVSSGSFASAQHGPSLRLGLEAGFGGEWGNPRGPAAGIYGQLGVQASPLLGIYYQPSLTIHALNDDSTDLFVAGGHVAMLDFTVGLLQFGAGAGIDHGRFATCDSDGDNCEEGSRRTDPGVAGRIAIVPRIHGPLARVGIPIAANFHTSFLDSNHRLTSIVLTVGIQRF